MIEAVAECSGLQPEELPPFYEAVEPDALDRLFKPMENGNHRHGGSIEFVYAGYLVRVFLHPEVEVNVASVAR